jgi:hypothetical protein
VNVKANAACATRHRQSKYYLRSTHNPNQGTDMTDLREQIEDAIYRNRDEWTRTVMVELAVDEIMAIPKIADAQEKAAEVVAET